MAQAECDGPAAPDREQEREPVPLALAARERLSQFWPALATAGGSSTARR
jgi:hypothetical protein